MLQLKGSVGNIVRLNTWKVNAFIDIHVFSLLSEGQLGNVPIGQPYFYINIYPFPPNDTFIEVFSPNQQS